MISAEYCGGKIRLGFLVGKFLSPHEITFSYCQMQLDGTIDNGVSTCEISRSEEGKIRLTEHFEWKSRPGEFGTNIFQEIYSRISTKLQLAIPTGLIMRLV